MAKRPARAEPVGLARADAAPTGFPFALDGPDRSEADPDTWRCPGCGARWGIGRGDQHEHHILGVEYPTAVILLCYRCNLREAAVRNREGTIYNSANPWAMLYKPEGYVPGSAGLRREMDAQAADAIHPVGTHAWSCLGKSTCPHVLPSDICVGLKKAGL